MSQTIKTDKYQVELSFGNEWVPVWFGGYLATGESVKKEMEKEFPDAKYRIVKVTTIKEIVE